MWNFFIQAMVTNKMAVIIGKCSIYCAWFPAVTTADKMTVLSLSYLDNLILCNNNLAFVNLVNYTFYFEFKIFSTKKSNVCHYKHLPYK